MRNGSCLSALAALTAIVCCWNSASAQGHWEGPFDLGISENVCSVTPPGAPSPCVPQAGGVCVYQDEIVHINLIPAGPWAGEMMMWSRCDLRPVDEPIYKFWRWNVSTGVVAPIDFPYAGQFGPFCSGQCWMLDPNDPDREGNPRPKLFLFGGRSGRTSDTADLCVPVGFRKGTNVAVTFDVIAGEWEMQNPLDSLPGHAGGQLLDGYYYPSLVPAFEDGPNTRYSVLAYGGSLYSSNEAIDCACDTLPEYGARLSHIGGSMEWQNAPFAGSGYRWHQYPRLFVLSHGGILHAGHAITCETPAACVGAMFDPYPGDNSGQGFSQNLCTLGYGQSPVHMLQPQGGGAPEPDDPNDLPMGAPSLAPANDYFNDPLLMPEAYDAINVQGRNVGSWHYCNGAIMHTLSDTEFWPPAERVAFDHSEHYDLDRVFITGGVYKQFPWDPLRPYQGTQLMVEYDSATGEWQRKADPIDPRALGSNLVILPTGKLFVVGGAMDNREIYLSQLISTEIFDPQTPDLPGEWTSGANRMTFQQGSFFPRNYHSVAILTQDGKVALTGGKHLWDSTAPNLLLDCRDVAEVYCPEYAEQGVRRPQLRTEGQPMHYPQTAWNEFSIKVEDANAIDRVCLIGAGSVTHHFDYGQRYVQLPMNVVNDREVSVIPPFNDRIAPPGYYMLFVVSTSGVPSVGKLVLLDYE